MQGSGGRGGSLESFAPEERRPEVDEGAVSSVCKMPQSWALSVFLNFFNKKMIVCIFYQVNLIGSGFFKLDWCRNGLLTL